MKEVQRKDAKKQFALSEIGQHAKDKGDKPEISGLGLDISQDKALSAVQLLMARTDYVGNLERVYTQSPDYRWDGFLPGLEFTVPEYLEAYGLEKDARGAFPSRQRALALEALRSLCLSRRLVYKKPRWKKGKKVYDVIVVYKPLIEMLEEHYGLEAAAAVERGEDLPGKVSLISLRPSPLLLGSLDIFHLLKSAGCISGIICSTIW